MGTVHAKGIDTSNDSSEISGPKIQLQGLKAKVEKIHIDGLGRTKDDIISKTVQSLFAAQDFQQVIFKANEVRLKLEALGCFKDVQIMIDTSEGPQANPDGLEVTFRVRELKRLAGSVSTQIGNNEGSLVFGARSPNMFGRAEKLQAEYSYGTKKSSSFNLAFTKPIVGPFNASWSTAAFQQIAEYSWSGFKEIDRGTFLELMFESAPRVQHSLRWEGVWRELSCLSRVTSFAVREEMGHTLKSSLRHILSVDKRDSPILPTRGVLFRLNQEFAGVGGDVGFHKHELELQYNHALPFDLVFQASLTGGLLKKLENNKVMTIADRFFLGGPLTLRGFATRGVGPHSDNCATGADTYWCSGAHIYSPLPLIRKTVISDLFRLHVFANAGNLGFFQNNEDYTQSVNALMENFRWSYGVGLVLRIGQVGRFELNYCVPGAIGAGDKAVAGLQFGVGVTVL